MKMRDVQTVTELWYQPCLKCGKRTFTDLLDSEGICDYCRETKSMKVSVERKNRKRKEPK